MKPIREALAIVRQYRKAYVVLNILFYVLAMLGVYIHGKSFIRPHSAGVAGHWRGYAEGVKRGARPTCSW